MGQYYKIVNADKHEYISPWDFDCGAKLLEWGYIVSDGTGNEFISAFHYLMSKAWKGDRVYVVGDYAELTRDKDAPTEFDVALKAISVLSGDDPNVKISAYGKAPTGANEVVGDIISKIVEATDKTGEEWLDVLEELYDQFDWLGTNDDDGYAYTLYRCDDKEFKNAKTRLRNGRYKDYIIPRYACNKGTKEYVDLRHLPIEWTLTDESDRVTSRHVSIDPLAVLLAMGNGQGGGDYFSVNKDLAGYWCKYSKEITFSDEIPLGYEELVTGFTERSAA